MQNRKIYSGNNGAPFPPRPTAGAVAGAVLATLALYLALPVMGRFAEPAADIMVRPVDTAPPSSPPPVRAVVEPEPEPEMTVPRSPRPELRRPERKAPVSAAMSLQALGSAFAGDFDLRLQDGDFLLAGQPPGTGIFDLQELDRAPQPISTLRPMYPPRARMQALEGWVLLEFIVDENGYTGDVEAVSAQPPGVFEQSAIRAVERWRFEPGRYRGREVSVRVRQRIRFQLER